MLTVMLTGPPTEPKPDSVSPTGTTPTSGDFKLSIPAGTFDREWSSGRSACKTYRRPQSQWAAAAFPLLAVLLSDSQPASVVSAPPPPPLCCHSAVIAAAHSQPPALHLLKPRRRLFSTCSSSRPYPRRHAARGAARRLVYFKVPQSERSDFLLTDLVMT